MLAIYFWEDHSNMIGVLSMMGERTSILRTKWTRIVLLSCKEEFAPKPLTQRQGNNFLTLNKFSRESMTMLKGLNFLPMFTLTLHSTSKTYQFIMTIMMATRRRVLSHSRWMTQCMVRIECSQISR
ncbi:unnamed protein product [Musa textilis]